MAKAGNYAAYQQSQPIAEDFGNNMLQAENQQFKYRQEKRYEDQQKAAKQAKVKESINTSLEKWKPIITGNRNADEALTQYYTQGIQAYGDIDRQLSNPNISQRDAQILWHRKNMLDKAPELLDASAKAVKDFTVKATEMMNSGKGGVVLQQMMDEAEAFFDMRGEQGIAIEIGPDGLPVYVGRTKDGRMFRKEVVNIVQGFDFNELAEKADLGTWTSNLIKNSLGDKNEISSEKGMVGTKQHFGLVQEAASELIDAEIGTVEDPSPFALSVFGDHLKGDIDKYDEAAHQKVKDHLMERAEAAYKEEFRGSQWRDNSSNDRKPSVTEAREIKESTSTYELTNRIYNLDAEALGAATYTVKRGDSWVMLEQPKVSPSGKELLFYDSDGKLQETVELANKENALRKIASLITGEAPPKAWSTYNHGAEHYQGEIPEPNAVVLPATKSMVPNKEALAPLDKMKNQGNAEALKSSLTDAFGDKGFTFVGSGSTLTIRVNGQEYNIELNKEEGLTEGWLSDTPRPEALQEIRQIIESQLDKVEEWSEPEYEYRNKQQSNTVKFN